MVSHAIVTEHGQSLSPPHSTQESLEDKETKALVAMNKLYEEPEGREMINNMMEAMVITGKAGTNS
jgi:hypothetical protein